ncbi:MAG: hypothetical protein EXR48_04745 [Dehalococcoidia bacterium]|nr:hypothetical protein [Dehalococcoidia bacterium]
MPNLQAHIALALQWSEALPSSPARELLGTYLLGSTVPDIRAMTRALREDTHFMELDSSSMTAGIDGLLSAHPGLAEASRLNGPTVAFLLGYFSHLVADQGWVTTVYRPYFANPSLFPDQVESKVLDRALQLEQDRSAQDAVQRVMPLLADAEKDVIIGFIPQQLLEEWREWLQEFLARGFTWDRLRFLARRRQQQEHLEAAGQVADRFLGSVDSGLARIAQRVPPESVRAYRERSARTFLRVSREFLRCAS